jgi:hypothetical protein
VVEPDDDQIKILKALGYKDRGTGRDKFII